MTGLPLLTGLRRRAAGTVCLLLVLALVLPLAGCGKKAAPLPPQDSQFPRQYPSW